MVRLESNHSSCRTGVKWSVWQEGEETRSCLQLLGITAAQYLLLVLATYVTLCIYKLVSWEVWILPILPIIHDSWMRGCGSGVTWVPGNHLSDFPCFDISPAKVNHCQQLPRVSFLTTHTSCLSMSRISGGKTLGVWLSPGWKKRMLVPNVSLFLEAMALGKNSHQFPK